MNAQYKLTDKLAWYLAAFRVQEVTEITALSAQPNQIKGGEQAAGDIEDRRVDKNF